MIWKSLFETLRIYPTTQINQFLYTSCFSCALYPDIIKSKINYAYTWFSMGIDHSSPYIHSTTVLCDFSFASSTSALILSIIKPYQGKRTKLVQVMYMYIVVMYTIACVCLSRKTCSLSVGCSGAIVHLPRNVGFFIHNIFSKSSLQVI